jgi:hypothetical protein
MTEPTDTDEFLKESIKIEPLAIQEEFVRMPADLAYWNGRYATALKAHLLAKLRLDETKSKLFMLHRERLLAAGARATEAQIEAAVETDPEYHQVRLAIIDAEVERSRARGIVEAVTTKRDMLVSLGSHIRTEMEGDIAIRSQHSNAHGRRD